MEPILENNNTQNKVLEHLQSEQGFEKPTNLEEIKKKIIEIKEKINVLEEKSGSPVSSLEKTKKNLLQDHNALIMQVLSITGVDLTRRDKNSTIKERIEIAKNTVKENTDAVSLLETLQSFFDKEYNNLSPNIKKELLTEDPFAEVLEKQKILENINEDKLNKLDKLKKLKDEVDEKLEETNKQFEALTEKVMVDKTLTETEQPTAQQPNDTAINLANALARDGLKNNSSEKTAVDLANALARDGLKNNSTETAQPTEQPTKQAPESNHGQILEESVSPTSNKQELQQSPQLETETITKREVTLPGQTEQPPEQPPEQTPNDIAVDLANALAKDGSKTNSPETKAVDLANALANDGLKTNSTETAQAQEQVQTQTEEKQEHTEEPQNDIAIDLANALANDGSKTNSPETKAVDLANALANDGLKTNSTETADKLEKTDSKKFYDVKGDVNFVDLFKSGKIDGLYKSDNGFEIGGLKILYELKPEQVKEIGVSSGDLEKLSTGDKIDKEKITKILRGGGEYNANNL